MMFRTINRGGPFLRCLPFFIIGLALVFPSMVVAGDANGILAYRDKLYDVQYVTDQIAWAVGYPAMVLRSDDGGINWQAVDAGTDEALYAVDFVDQNNGWIVGRTGTVIHTADGGKTWIKQNPGTREPLFGLDFLDAQTGCVVGNFGQVFWTDDGGKTWKDWELEAMLNAALNTVVLLNAQTALVGGDYPSWELDLVEDLDPDSISNIYRTEDKGATWQVIPTGSTRVLFDLKFLADQTTGYAVGSRGEMLTTTDAGLTWTKIATDIPNHLIGLYPKGQDVWAVGLEGVIIKVTGGAVSVVPSDGYQWLSSIAFNSSGRGIIVGARGTLLQSENEGGAWK